MIPQRAWWRGNPRYDALWATATPQRRLQRRVLEAVLEALPEGAALALVDELLHAEQYGQVQALRTAELTDGVIKVVLQAAADRCRTYRMNGHEVQMVPVSELRKLLGQTDVSLD